MQKSLQNSILRRYENLRLHNSNPILQAIAKARCAKDIEYFVNEWVWTFDPRLDVPFIPMELFPKQAEFLHWIEQRERTQGNGMAFKTRDMGFTWLAVCYLAHAWLFRDGFKGAVGSRKEKLVDTQGDPDSIFEKLRILLRNLPGWMMPDGFSWKRDDNFCKLINPANQSTITGEAGDNIGRGGRNSIYFVDEAAFIEHPQTVDAALSTNTNVRIDISTPNGMGNPFYAKVNSGKVPVFEMGWQDDPRKNHWELIDDQDKVIDSGAGWTEPESIPEGHRIEYPWYREMQGKLDPVTLAQEVDRDFSASIEGLCIPAKWVRSAVDLAKRIRLKPSDYAVAGLDVADGGDAKSVLTIRRGPVVGLIESRKEGGTTDIAFWALDIAKTEGARTLNYDSVGVGAGIGGAYTARARTSPLGLTAHGINVGQAPTEAKWPDGKTAKERFRNLKAELWFTMRSRFEKTYEHIELGIDHPRDELISIPNNPDLIRDLSTPKYFATDTGKTLIESKSQLAQRGVASPDFAESLMLTFAPVKRLASSAVGGERKAVTSFKPI